MNEAGKEDNLVVPAKPPNEAGGPAAEGGGGQGAPGMAMVEEKILEGAGVEVVNAVYEEDFRGFSYGFRPGRGPHDAMDALAVGITERKVNWILDADVSDFFSKLDHSWMERFLEHRIADNRVLRLIRKWMTAWVIR